MITDYGIGNDLRCRVTFRDQLTGDLVTPDNLQFHVVMGGLDTVIFVYGIDRQVALVSLGVYDLIVTLLAAGPTRIRAITTGSRNTSNVAIQQVSDPNF